MGRPGRSRRRKGMYMSRLEEATARSAPLRNTTWRRAPSTSRSVTSRATAPSISQRRTGRRSRSTTARQGGRRGTPSRFFPAGGTGPLPPHRRSRSAISSILRTAGSGTRQRRSRPLTSMATAPRTSLPHKERSSSIWCPTRTGRRKARDGFNQIGWGDSGVFRVGNPNGYPRDPWWWGEQDSARWRARERAR